MAVSVSLRRSLRKIPAFRSLPGKTLADITHRLVCKEYRPGDVLWRSNAQMDFLGIIQHGEILVEYYLDGKPVRCVRLTAGDFVLPRSVSSAHSTIFVRAITDVRLYILSVEQIGALQPFLSDGNTGRKSRRKNTFWNGIWILFVAALIVIVTWNDATRIASGALYLASKYTTQSSRDIQSPMNLLEYATSLDQNASFAYNQEGIIWFQNKDLQNARTAFMRALAIEPDNGPARNNLAVTYFPEHELKSLLYLQDAGLSSPDNAIVKYNLGLTLINQDRPQEALRALREASLIAPEWVFPYLQQGSILIEMQEYIRAEQVCRKAIQLDPAQRSAHLTLAIALFHQQREIEALKSVEDALRLEKNDQVARFYKARILFNLGEADAALAILTDLLDSAHDPQQIIRISDEIEAISRFQRVVPMGVR